MSSVEIKKLLNGAVSWSGSESGHPTPATLNSFVARRAAAALRMPRRLPEGGSLSAEAIRIPQRDYQGLQGFEVSGVWGLGFTSATSNVSDRRPNDM